MGNNPALAIVIALPDLHCTAQGDVPDFSALVPGMSGRRET